MTKSQKDARKAALVAIFKGAFEAAAKFKDEPDGGSCNFDSVTLVPGRNRTILEAAKEAGCAPGTGFTWMGRKAYWLHIGSTGQGMRNTIMAEAAERHIRNALIQQGLYTAEEAMSLIMMYYRVD